MGASPRSASPISPFLTTGGVNPQKGTHRREMLSTLPTAGICGPIDRLQRVETRRKCSGDLTTQEPNSAQIKHRRSVSGAAQMVAELRENAVASASASSALALLH